MLSPKRVEPLRTLVIPDIHHRIKQADKIIAKETSLAPVDEIVFLGDYFDDFGDNPGKATKTATWIKQKLRVPTNVLLYGNHDLAYAFPKNNTLYCSGFSNPKAEAINKVLWPADWQKIKLYHYSQGWLMSHAGVHPSLLHPYKEPLESIEILAREAMAAITEGQHAAFVGAGYARGGTQKVGGITWLDFRHEFEPIKGINQLVGHTPMHGVQHLKGADSDNWGLDVRGAYAVIVNGNLEIKYC